MTANADEELLGGRELVDGCEEFGWGAAQVGACKDVAEELLLTAVVGLDGVRWVLCEGWKAYLDVVLDCLAKGRRLLHCGLGLVVHDAGWVVGSYEVKMLSVRKG